MIKTMVLFIFIFFYAYSKCDTISRNDSLFITCTKYHSNNNKKSEITRFNKKYHGKKSEWYKNGKLNTVFNYEFGKIVGEGLSYHPNGKLKFKIPHKDGKREGFATWYYNNGKTKKKDHYVQGKRDGLCTSWHKNGVVSEKTNYLKNKKHGKSEKWYANGQKEYEFNFVKNKPISTKKYYESGQMVFERTFKEGTSFVISAKYYSPDGKFAGFIKDNVGQYLTYYKGGRIRRYKWSAGTSKAIGGNLSKEEALKAQQEIEELSKK